MIGAALRSIRASRRANAATEFALLLPLMILFVGGVVEFGRAFQVYEAVDRLATRDAIAWADCSDATIGVCQVELALYVTPAAIANLSPQLTNAVSLRMMEVTMSGATATVIYAYPLGITPSAAELAQAQSVIGSGNTGVIVTAAYTHTLIFFQQIVAPFLGASRLVSYTVAQRKA